MSVTWSKSDDECEEETTNKVMAFNGKYESEEDSSDEDMIKEELVAIFRLLHNKWEKDFLTRDK